MQDLRFAFRQLLKNPGFTAVAVLTLALCIGANLAIFAVVDAILVRPLPFPQSDRLVTIFNSYPKAGIERIGSSVVNYYEGRGSLDSFSQLALWREGTGAVGEAGSPAQEIVAHVTPEFFAVLGVGPGLGRAFTEEEMSYETDDVAILTDAYWRRHFNADPAILGRQVRVDGQSKTIIGVLPPGFRFLSSKARLFLPHASSIRDRAINRRYNDMNSLMIARLKPGAALGTAQAELDAHNAAHAAEDPIAKIVAEGGGHSVVTPLHADHVQSIRPTLWLLQGGVFFLLLIGGVNLVNLLLIRASSRARELSIRQSLGAGRRQVIRQVMTETVLLTLIGGMLGLGVGAAGIHLLAAMGVERLPLGTEVAFNGRLALAALAGSVALGVVIALPLAWFHLRGSLVRVLQSDSRGGTGSLAVQRLRHGFIVAQIALAFVLLTSAGLLGLSLQRVLAVSPGFQADHTLTGRITLPSTRYADDEARLAFTERLLEEVGRLPGVSAVGVTDNVPLSGTQASVNAIPVMGHVPQPGDSLRVHYNYGVNGEYFAALGIPLLEGRGLEAADSRRDERICVVDEDFAKRYWPQGEALGQRLFRGLEERPAAEAFRVVGVVRAVKQADLTESQAQGAVYFPYRHHASIGLYLVARTGQHPDTFAATLQQVVRGLDPELPITDLHSMEVRIADSLVARRSPALLAGIFAAVALTLAAIGTYGVLAYAVAQRRREIGVRMALGALPGQIGRHFLAQGLRLLSAGMVLGILGAWGAGQMMQGVLFDVPPLHPATLAGTVVVMTMASLLACWLPSRRATKVDPMEALRTE